MVQAVPSLIAEVKRGPDWLLVKLGASHLDEDKSTLADCLSSLMDQHFTYRIVLDCSEIPLFDSTLIGQLLELEGRIRTHGGLLRLCELSAFSQAALRQCRLESRLPHFADCGQAIMGRHFSVAPRSARVRPSQPR